MKRFIIPFLLLAVFVQPSGAQDVKNEWAKWKYLLGQWKGEGDGQPGQGSGIFSFQEELGGSIITRKNKTDFPAMGNRPAFSHEDLTIVYKNPEGNPVKAVYFDNENHVINYNITYTDNQVIMTSVSEAPGPRFRLTYEKAGDDLMKVRFEMAMPNAPEDFKIYLDGKSRRIK